MVCIPAVNMIGNNVVNQSESFGFFMFCSDFFSVATLRESERNLIVWVLLIFL
jgi:hypothetical protein